MKSYTPSKTKMDTKNPHRFKPSFLQSVVVVRFRGIPAIEHGFKKALKKWPRIFICFIHDVDQPRASFFCSVVLQVKKTATSLQNGGCQWLVGS